MTIKLDTFETWFNGNCGLVINRDSFYYVWIVIYEPRVRRMGKRFEAIKYHHTYYSSLSGASSKTWDLKNKLKSNDFHAIPMLDIHPKANSYEYFSNLITSPYVAREWLFYKISEPDLHFKPLDLIKVDEGDYKHVGVYIGNNLVCHFTKKDNVVRIDWWSTFIEDYHKGNGEITSYHPMIPFKNYRKIAKQIACVEDAKFRRGEYDLANRNCEHFANMIVYGINYSEQIEDKKDMVIAKNIARTLGGFFSIISNNYSINNGKGSTIKLTNEMSEANDKLGWRTNDRSEAIERRYLQEVPPKENCRIM